MISIAEAARIVRDATRELDAETVALGQSVGRILAENVIADVDLPPFDRSQMDGFAVRAEDVNDVPARLKIVGEAAAGNGWRGELKSNETVRIMTGAPVPVGADAVQKLEEARENDDFVEILQAVKTGENIVRRAAEISAGKTVFERGEPISAAMIASLASFGYARVRVFRRPKVAILATGNELVNVDETPGVDQIRNSNSVTLRAFAEQCGAIVEELPLVDDSIENLKSKIQSLDCDALILSGGVSVGKYDFTKPALRELGAEILFEKVALRPGKPTVFAKMGETLVFGLPGNPVSAIVTFNLFARTAILQMQGASRCELQKSFGVLIGEAKGAKERDSFLPARVVADERGQNAVELLKWGGSSDFVAFARTNCLAFVPRESKLKNGDIVEIRLL